MYITNHCLVAVHNVSCAVLVLRLIVFTCCEPPRCLQVRRRLTCSNRPPNRFISSRFAVAGARSFVPTTHPPSERRPKIYARTFFPRRHCGRRMRLSRARAAAAAAAMLGRPRLAAHIPNTRNVLLLLLSSSSSPVM